MNKRYNWDEHYSLMSGETRYTQWIAVIKGDAGKPMKATAALYATASVSEKFVAKYPVKFEGVYPACLMEPDDQEHYAYKKMNATYIPFLSTEKGWKWNRRQILSLLKEYPNTSKHLLSFYLGDPYLQIRLKKVMGKHFRPFVREIKTIDPKMYVCRITNFTIKKVNRDDYHANTQIERFRLRVLCSSTFGIHPGFSNREDDLRVTDS